ncbi:hypothetical protein, partial [Pedobacter antarcticus]
MNTSLSPWLCTEVLLGVVVVYFSPDNRCVLFNLNLLSIRLYIHTYIYTRSLEFKFLVDDGFQ